MTTETTAGWEEAEEASPASTATAEGWRWWFTEKLPFWLFVVGVVAVPPAVLFGVGRYQWFLRDEWVLLSDTRFPPAWFEPSAGAHLIIVPRLAYWVLWELFGVTTYKPYLLLNVLLHLLAVVMLRIVIRRSGVSQWIATAAAGSMLLFGPGEQGILLAFQIGFTGSIAWGMVHLVLADSEGGFKRRDLLALAFGLLAITSSGIGVVTTVTVGVAVLLRRGWLMAIIHTVPLITIYAVWSSLNDVQSAAPRPSPEQLLRWDRVTLTESLKGLAHFDFVAYALVAVLVVGSIVILVTGWADGWRDLARRNGFAIAMLVGMVAGATITGLGRGSAGVALAGSSRYVYMQAFLMLAAIAVCAEAIAKRWPLMRPLVVVLLLVPIPFNTTDFGGDAFGRNYFEQREYILRTAIRMPFAEDVPRDVRPVPDAFDSENLTIGFLLDAERDGKIEPSTIPITDEIENEFRIRLGLMETFPLDGVNLLDCTVTRKSFEFELEKGDVIGMTQQFDVVTIDRPGGKPTSNKVRFNPPWNGVRFEAVLPDLHVRIIPLKQGPPMRVCPTPPTLATGR